MSSKRSGKRSGTKKPRKATGARAVTPGQMIDVADTRPVIKATKGAPPTTSAQMKAALDDDRPTEIHEVIAQQEVMTSREQLITGFTIGEMIKNPKHALSGALAKLVDQARTDLPGAKIDAKSSLLLRHEFEFDRRVGYRLKLKLFDRTNQCVEVQADVDQDGKAIRRGSLISKLFTI